MDSNIRALSSKVITPYGQQLKDRSSWYPQELCNDWPHRASALSFGESSVMKYCLSYPRRMGLDCPEEKDFVEYTEYIRTDLRSTPPSSSCSSEIEEIFVSRGVCVVSKGPIGGPSNLKGIYRPLNSYGTGIGIRSVVKASFVKSLGPTKSKHPVKENYICLVEKAGISMYCEDSSETHVTYFPEFCIDRLVPTDVGLLVVPSRLPNDNLGNETPADKRLYILTHPLKQVSKVWSKNQPAQDYTEYQGSNELFLGCQGDLCVFWSLRHDKIILRRLVNLEPADVLHCSQINSTNHHQTLGSHPTLGSHDSNRPYTPQPSIYSPFRRPSTSNGMRPARDASSNAYNSTMADSSMNHGLAHGFYPSHVCVYDDPEVYLRHLFNIDLIKGPWIPPTKFRFAISPTTSSSQRTALVCRIWNRIYLWGLDINSARRLSHYCISEVEDFACSDVQNGSISFMVLLHTNKEIKIGFFDSDFQFACSTILETGLVEPPRGIQCVLFGDTIVIDLEKKKEKGLVHLRNYGKHGLIRKCIEGFKKELNWKSVVKIVARYMANLKKGHKGSNVYFDCEWEDFVGVVGDVIAHELPIHRGALAGRILRVVESLKENLKIHGYFAKYSRDLLALAETLAKYSKEKFGKKLVVSQKSVFECFANLILHESPTTAPEFEDLPEIMQLILAEPDKLQNLQKIVEIKRRESSFVPAIEILIADILLRNQIKVKFNWPEGVIKAVGRYDYLGGTSGIITPAKLIFAKDREEIMTDEITWMLHVLKMKIFTEDRRLEEVCRLLDSASPMLIDVEQRTEMSDHEYVEEQEKHVLQLVQVAFSAPVGRAAFTLRTEKKDFANLTSHIFVPKLCVSGKCAVKGTSIDLNESDLPASYTAWPSFHNAVASALSVRFLNSPADAWFAYNKTKTSEGSEQAGMVLGFGLNGILSSMPPTLRHEYLAKENSFTTMSMLLGLSANLAGSGDIATWKLISLHISAMLPACTTELEIPRFATLVAPLSLGLLFLGTHNTHIAKVLLGEIAKRYSPLSVFGTNAFSNSATNVNLAEMSAMSPDREAHTLCAGYGLGFVNLGKGRLNQGSIDDGIDGVLRRFVVGGPKPSHPNGGLGLEEEDVLNQFGQSLPSLWEEYRCCHIEEGDNVNVDVTTPAAIIAVALIYLRSGSEAVLKWLSPPTTLHLLDGVRPDLLMLRSLASILVLDQVTNPEVGWLEEALMPAVLSQQALKPPDASSRRDYESINQAWASIVCGYCLGLGIRFAGTSDAKVKSTLWHYTDLILKISSVDSKLSEYFPKNFLESTACNLLISLALVSAGTGEVKVLRLCRYLQNRVALTPITTSSNTYGLEMCIAMATGILFLGGGRYSLSNDDRSIAVILASVFPKWPINASDNRYHLQALRHLYVLAAQPRLILPKPMPKNKSLKFYIEFLDGLKTQVDAPVLLPPFYLIKKIRMESKEYLPIEFRLPHDEVYLKRITEGGGVINLVPKPLSAQQLGFVQEMTWRQEHTFHPTFAIDNDTPAEERITIESFNQISRLGEWNGIPQTVPAFLELRHGNCEDPSWIWQVRILYWWVLKCEARKVESAIRKDLLAVLLAKAEGKLELFPEKKLPVEVKAEPVSTASTLVTRSQNKSDMEH